jgi:methyl-accepting chemotaxis protein
MPDNSPKISNLTKIVDEIAFRASLLALHASIAMAGEGEGVMEFGAMADEARDLARRGAQAALLYRLFEEEQTL